MKSILESLILKLNFVSLLYKNYFPALAARAELFNTN